MAHSFLTSLPTGSRIGILAGNGQLPVDVAVALGAAKANPFVIMIKGEADPKLTKFDHAQLELEKLGFALEIMRNASVTHVVMAGGITRRPKLTKVRPPLKFLAQIPKVFSALAGRGDDGLLRVLVGILEDHGFSVVGAHQIIPDILAEAGCIAGRKPTASDRLDIEAASLALRSLGTLDIGQAAVAVTGRVVAIEGPEGTDAVLRRVQDIREAGRLSGKKGGVLVKLAKPAQEIRADLPSIGPATIKGVAAAGLNGVAIDAGKSLILRRSETLELARNEGVFIFGLESAAP